MDVTGFRVTRRDDGRVDFRTFVASDQDGVIVLTFTAEAWLRLMTLEPLPEALANCPGYEGAVIMFGEERPDVCIHCGYSAWVHAPAPVAGTWVMA